MVDLERDRDDGELAADRRDERGAEEAPVVGNLAQRRHVDDDAPRPRARPGRARFRHTGATPAMPARAQATVQLVERAPGQEHPALALLPGGRGAELARQHDRRRARRERRRADVLGHLLDALLELVDREEARDLDRDARQALLVVARELGRGGGRVSRAREHPGEDLDREREPEALVAAERLQHAAELPLLGHRLAELAAHPDLAGRDDARRHVEREGRAVGAWRCDRERVRREAHGRSRRVVRRSGSRRRRSRARSRSGPRRRCAR